MQASAPLLKSTLTQAQAQAQVQAQVQAHQQAYTASTYSALTNMRYGAAAAAAAQQPQSGLAASYAVAAG